MTDEPTTAAGARPRTGLLGIEQEASAGMDQGMRVLSYLIAGVAFYGGLGWLGDHLLHTRFLLPIGIVLGAGLGVYMIIRRFGQVPSTTPTPVASRPSTATSTPGTPSTGQTTEGAA